MNKSILTYEIYTDEPQKEMELLMLAAGGLMLFFMMEILFAKIVAMY